MSALPNHAELEAAATDAAPEQRGVARPLTILEGSSFCICDEFGDIGSFETSGFFDDDVRFLSRLRLTINGESPLLLESRKVDYFSAAFYLRNPLARGLAQDTLLIARERFIGAGMEEQIVVRNETPELEHRQPSPTCVRRKARAFAEHGERRIDVQDRSVGDRRIRGR